MSDRAYLAGERLGGFKWCVFPCQKRDENGNRIERECAVSVDPRHKVHWQVSGPPDAPTLSPSVNCQSDRCWHGFIVNGEVRP